MVGHDSTVSTAENYRRFGRQEAAGRSPAYERLALGVSTDRLVLTFLRRLPPAKRQPNLLFAAARRLLGSPPDLDSLRALIAGRGGELRSLMLARSTQTNEPARCASLLPALGLLPEPLALLEVGAAAGLTLLPDAYSYDFGGHRIAGADPDGPILRCLPIGPVPLPGRTPEVVWRAGIDLNPLNVGDADDLDWLRCLIWPGEADRDRRLQRAAAMARRHPPQVHRGDLLTDLSRVAALAPPEATLVVYHSAVLAYVPEQKRREFGAAVRALGAVWLSNEAPGVLPDLSVGPPGGAGFIVAEGGTRVLARTDPHGTWLEWLA